MFFTTTPLFCARIKINLKEILYFVFRIYKFWPISNWNYYHFCSCRKKIFVILQLSHCSDTFAHLVCVCLFVAQKQGCILSDSSQKISFILCLKDQSIFILFYFIQMSIEPATDTCGWIKWAFEFIFMRWINANS